MRDFRSRPDDELRRQPRKRATEREEIIANADAEMRRVMGHPLRLEMNWNSLMGVVGLVQLACRHPGVSDELRKAARYFVDCIGASLQEQGLHGLVTLIQAGWDPSMDEGDESE